MTSKTKPVGKGDIRRLMKETKTKLNSPLAKYNAAGQLTCILCSAVVKNELVWPAHVNGKLHKENVVNLKTAKPLAAPSVATNGVKRKHDNGTSVPPRNSSSSSSLPADFFEGASAAKAPRMEKLKIIPLSERKPAGILKNKKPDPPALPPDPKEIKTPANISPPPVASTIDAQSIPSSSSSSLPADFYDSKTNCAAPSISNDHGDTKQNENTDSDPPPAESGEIPDGFFDDPVEDAKVHHKAYVDPLDAQWELFQKEIKMEAHKSEVIEEEDEDVMIYERALAEVDNQLEGWAKVEALHVKKETKFIKIEIKDDGESVAGEQNDANTNEPVIKIEPKEEAVDEVKEERDDDDDSDDDDDEDFDDLLDWRSKGTW